VKKIVRGLLFLVVVVGIVLYAAGTFKTGQVAPGVADQPPGVAAPARIAQAGRIVRPVYEEAVGTVQSRTRVRVAAQVIARVLEVNADAGQNVQAGAPLVRLDDREFKARLEQARQALAAAEAARERAVQAKARGEALLTQAKARRARIQRLLEGNAATPEQMEAAEAGYLEAEAGVAEAQAAIAASEAQIQQARNVVTEAEVALGHTRIVAPIDGVVAEREADPGDLASPGQTLLVVLDPRSLRLEAQVREGLITRVQRGDTLKVALPAAGRVADGEVAEILPAADPRSRTFRVRVDLDAAPDLYPGMFGRLRIPVGERSVVSLPAAAVVRVGQLELVTVHDGDVWLRRYVTTGRALPDGHVEVLSGLQGDEEVGLP
jgi:multidrug efflux pump subunit AcrA (membrane-fusion protein)